MSKEDLFFIMLYQKWPKAFLAQYM